MIIGILYEGEYDYDPLTIILTKMLGEISKTEEIKFVPRKCNGGIYEQREDAVKLFFDLTPQCDFAVFLNDMDKDKERCRNLKTFASKEQTKNSSFRIIVACPDPSLEEWFFIEENALKKVLRLNSLTEIERTNKHPKQLLQQLIREYGDITDSSRAIYRKISESIHLKTLIVRNKPFQQFHEDTIKMMKSCMAV